MDFGSRDIISSLPNHLISQILSFLSTKEAASTSVLSKHWRYLFAFVTNLVFDDSMYLHSQEADHGISNSFMEFVERVLALQENGTVNKFSLRCNYYLDDDDQVRVTGWILDVLRRGVSELQLVLWQEEYPLPCKIFVSKTLVRLKLRPIPDDHYCFRFTSEVEDVFLPKLKFLYLDSVFFEEKDIEFAKLLSGCPVLEELVLMNINRDSWKSFSVSITTLKRLTFFCEEDSDHHQESVSFDTPNLEYLEYSDTIAGKYPKVNFDSLVEAHIGLRLTEDQQEDAWFSEDDYFSEDDDEEKGMVGDATDFLMGIRNVQKLYLSAQALEVLTFCCEETPVFNNLIQLTIESNSEIGWDSLPGLFKNCPNLESLVFKGLVHINNDGCGNVCCCKNLKNPSCLSSSPVKFLKIFLGPHHYDDRMKEMMQVKHFLEKMPLLEQLIVHCNTSNKRAVSKFSKWLHKIPRKASPKCEIQVIPISPKKLSLSSTLPSS